MTKPIIVACAALVLVGCATAAQAGDIGLAPASYDWSGGYVGLSAGAAFNNSQFKTDYGYRGNGLIAEADRNLINGLDQSSKQNQGAFAAGILAGYNIQMSNVVIGVEGDFSYLGFNDTVKGSASDVMDQLLNAGATDKIDYEASWYGTVRARAGYAFDNVLFYGTGGLAYGQLDVSQKLRAASGGGSAAWSSESDAWKMGWTLGGGIEYAVDRWTLGLEYLYVDLGTYDWGGKANVKLADAAGQALWSEVRQRGEADFAFSVAQATLKYRF